MHILQPEGQARREEGLVSPVSELGRPDADAVIQEPRMIDPIRAGLGGLSNLHTLCGLYTSRKRQHQLFEPRERKGGVTRGIFAVQTFHNVGSKKKKKKGATKCPLE